MEPIAPGTEDEPPIGYSSSTKQEKERERLLSVRSRLPNGEYGNVFEFKYINGAEHWYCNACACPVMGWVFHHETGKRHTMAIGAQSHDRHSTLAEADEPGIKVAPGEPIPPGFEGQIEKVALIQERLDVFNVGPLVALEYLLELRDYDINKEPTYLCVLCDKKGDPRTVLTHLASFKHILQYLQKHFPTCYRALAPYMTKQYKRNWQSTLHEIAEGIEKKFGRLKPIPVEAGKYEKDTVYYVELIAKGRHFSELNGYTFEELVNKEELTKIHDDDDDKYGFNSNLPKSQKKRSPSPPFVANPIKKIKPSSSGTAATASAVGSRRRSLSSVSSISTSDMSDAEIPNRKNQPLKKSRSRSPYYRNRSRSKSPYSRRYVRRSPPPRHEPHRPVARDRSLMPWEKPNYRRPKNEFALDNRNKMKPDKIEEYRKLCKAIESDMERALKSHKKNPEKHPQYNDEWKKFWNKRYKELQLEAKDVNSHDFKPEWIEFWNKRMIELHQDELKVKKDGLRRRLGLPEEPAPISFRIMPKSKKDGSKNSPSESAKPIPPSAMPDHDPEVIIIEDLDEESKGSRRSRSPWEDEPPSRVSSRDAKSRDRTRSREREILKRERSPRISSRDRSRERDRDYRSNKSWDYKDYKEYRPRIRTVADLPWNVRNELPEYYKPPAIMRDVTRKPVHNPGEGPPSPVDDDLDDEEVNVVAVLRLLTAVEEKLGSLGPKIIDLLAQALALEKNEANSSENLLDNDINCVLFETVKEKLKGQLLAGLVEHIQQKAFKKAIKKTAGLIHLAGERKKEKEKNQPKVDPVKVPGVGTVDKAAIAKQIANALILQGKTDVTQAELEQLINAVVGMAEASRNSNKPMTTATFLEQIGKAGSSKVETCPVPPPPAPVKLEPKPTANSMEGLSDSDLQTLLQNFKDLSTDEQHSLINYLKKLEAHEPDRVERLRKFVNLGSGPQNEPPKPVAPVPKRDGRQSPFSHRTGSVNPSGTEIKVEMDGSKVSEKSEPMRIPIDSDEEDYTFDDVVKTVSNNVKQKELEKERENEAKKDDLNLDKTKALISNIMNNINKSDKNNLVNVSSADFAKTLNSIPVNMANLASIVGTVQSLTNKQSTSVTTAPKSNFPTNSYRPEVDIMQDSNRPYPPQNYQQRPNFNMDRNPPNPMGSYGGPPQGIRPNVSYPVDANKVAYPNYGQKNDARRPNSQFPYGNTQYPNNRGPNYNNRW